MQLVSKCHDFRVDCQIQQHDALCLTEAHCKTGNNVDVHDILIH